MSQQVQTDVKKKRGRPKKVTKDAPLERPLLTKPELLIRIQQLEFGGIDPQSAEFNEIADQVARTLKAWWNLPKTYGVSRAVTQHYKNELERIRAPRYRAMAAHIQVPIPDVHPGVTPTPLGPDGRVTPKPRQNWAKEELDRIESRLNAGVTARKEAHQCGCSGTPGGPKIPQAPLFSWTNCIKPFVPASDYFSYKKDEGKPRMDLIPAGWIKVLAAVVTAGAQKYGENTWPQVPNGINRYYAALMRHLLAYRDGELCDEDGQFHLAKVALNAFYLLSFETRTCGCEDPRG